MPVFNQNTVDTPTVDVRDRAAGIPSILPTFKPISGINIPNFNLGGEQESKPVRPKFFTNSFIEASAFPQTSSFAEAKKYPAFDPFRDNEDFYARNQGFWKSVGNGLGRLVLTAGTKLGTGVGYLAGLAGFGNSADSYGDDMSAWLAGAGDNALAKWFEHIENDKIKTDWLPIYQEAKDRNKGFFSRALTDLNFWTSDVVDGAAFMASAFVPAAAVSKIGMGAKAVRGLAALEQLTAAEEAAALSDVGLATGTAEQVSMAAPTIESVGNGLEHLPRVLSWIDNAKLARNIDVGTTAFINTASESMFEANQVKDNVYDTLIGQRDKYTGKNIYTPDQARQIAAKSARDTYAMNLGALSLSNLWEANLFFKKLPATAGSSFLGKVATKGLLEDAELAKKTFGRNVLSFVSPIAQGIGVEGLWEENIQLAIQRLNQSDENFDLNFTDKLSRVGKNYVSQTINALAGNDLEAAENIGIGGLIGAIAGKAFNVSANAQLKNKVANLNHNISFFKTLGSIYETEENGSLKIDNDGNPKVDIDKIKAFVASANKVLTLQEIANNLESRGQHTLAAVYKDELFARFAKAHFDSGLSDLLYQKLNDVQNLKREDLLALGFDPNSNPAQIAEIANNLKEHAQALESLYNSIQENTLPLRKDKGGKKAYDIKNKLFYLSARAQSLAKQKNKAKADYEKVRADTEGFDSNFNSETDSVHDEYNSLFERLEAAKRNKDRVQSEKEYFASLAYPDGQTDYEQNGVSVQFPKSKIQLAEEKGIAITTPVFNDQAIDDEIQARQKELDEFTAENAEVLNRLTKDARGRYLYEIRSKNLLPSAKEMERQEIIQTEMELAHNATVSVMSRLADLKYGEKYYDDTYGPALQRHAEENNIFDAPVEEPVVQTQPPVIKAPNPARISQDDIDEAYDHATQKEPVTNKAKVVTHIADKINNGEELSEKEQALKDIFQKEINDELVKTSKDNEEIFEKINELEKEKEAIENKEEPDVDDEARKDQIDKQLEELRQQLEARFEEETIEDAVEASTNIKPEDKDEYKEVLLQIAKNKKLVKSTPAGWEINGQLYRKVTSLIGDEIPEEVRDKVQNAINAGFTIDEIVKAYFDGTLNIDFRMQVQDKISSSALDNVIKNLDRIKKKLRDKGIEIVATNVMTWDEETKIAGEIDILGVDRNGNFKIYEVQARRPDIYRIYGQRGTGIKIREVDAKRLSAYRNLFANQYRVVPDEISVMFPFQVKYKKDDSSGYIEDAKAKESIRFLPTNLVEIKRKLLTPVRSGSKFDTLDMLHIFGQAFLTSDTAKAKFRFLLRNVPFAEVKSKMILSVRKAAKNFQDRYAKQEELLHGIDNGYKPTKYKGFENLYSLVGDHELALKYDGNVIGYLSPSPALAYKDASGKFKVLDENIDEQTYTETTGNSKQTFSDFKHIATAYSGAYNYLMKRLGESDGVDIDGEELNNLFEVKISYGELDKIGTGEERPDLKDLSVSGVKAGNKVIPIVVHINKDDSVKVVTDKKANKGKTVYRKLQEIDRWANNNIEKIVAAITSKDGRRATEFIAIVETPNKEYRILALKNKGKFNIDIYDDFVPDLGSKFTASVTKNVFKNENIVVIPKYNEENINVDLEDQLIAKVYPTEDAKELEKFGIHPSELDDKQAREIAENFLSSLTDEQRGKLGQELGQVDQLLQDYQNSEWADINDYLNNLRECKL